MAEAAALTVVLDPAPAPIAAPTGPAAGADGTGSAAAGLPGPFPPGGSGESPDSGSGGSAGAPAAGVVPATEPVTTADTDTVFTVSGPAPVAPGSPTTTAAPPTPAAGNAPVATQLAPQMAVLRNAPDGSQTMTVVITPESLGPVTVHVTITHGTLDLTLHGAHEAGRQALLGALPELRRELEGAGLTFSKLEVDTSGGDSGAGLRNAQQQLLDAHAGQQGGSGQPGQQVPRPRTWGAGPDHLEGSTALSTDQSTSSGVDVRV
jgi:flagellar hook-length control protein FliK